MSGPTPTTTAAVTPGNSGMGVRSAKIDPKMEEYLNSNRLSGSKFYPNIAFPPFANSLEDLVKVYMNLERKDVYGNGNLLHSCGMVNGSRGYFLLIGFLNAMEGRENPNPFAIPLLVYICSKSQSEIDQYNPDLHSDGVDVELTRTTLVNYINQQEREILTRKCLTDEEGSSFYSDVWCRTSRWIRPLSPKYYKAQEKVTADNIKPFIQECYKTLITSSNNIEIMDVYVKLHTEFGIIFMQRDELFGLDLGVACNILFDTISSSNILRTFPDVFDLRKSTEFSNVTKILSLLTNTFEKKN